MFISTLDLFKIGIGPSSSHTMGPMVAAKNFRDRLENFVSHNAIPEFLQVRCTLRGSLAFTGKGHATDRAVTLGMHRHTPIALAKEDVNTLFQQLWQQTLGTTAPEVGVSFPHRKTNVVRMFVHVLKVRGHCLA